MRSKCHSRLNVFLISALAIIVVCVEITAGIAQQLAPTPPIRRGADGQIEIVPQNAHPPAPVAAAPKNSGARPDDRQPDATSLDPPAHLAQPAIQPLVSVEKSSMSGSDHPPRGAHVVSQIHNAPGWLHSHTYTYATGPYTRVVNGPGWNEAGGSYNPGQTLSAYQLTSDGRCTSAPGGGPTGTGSSIQDGSCTWKYLSQVDYISLTGWAFDNRPWRSGTVYHYRDYVVADAPLRAYALENNDGCTSIVAPAGTGRNSLLATNDGCRWRYFADILYSSQRSFVPTQTFVSNPNTGIYNPDAATVNLKTNYEAHLWNDREYLAGTNGELAPMRTQAHFDYTNDVNDAEIGWVQCKSAPCYHIIVTTAPGEGFRDKLKPSDPLSGYDPTKGVALHNSSGHGFQLRDALLDLVGLQIKSDSSSAVEGFLSTGNSNTIQNCILEGGNSVDPTVSFDFEAVLANSLVISHGKIGILSKYPMIILHSTILNPDHVPNSVGIESYWQWDFAGTVISNTGVFGFTNAAAHLTIVNGVPGNSFWLGDHNATDAGATDSGSLTSAFKLGYTVDPLPGAKYGVSIERAFVAPGSDWRLSSGSPLIGAGSAYGSFSVNCHPNVPKCPALATYNFDTPDIIGTPRPQAGRYDIGAWQATRAVTAN